MTKDEALKMAIEPQDIRIETFSTQESVWVGKTNNGVRITHIPTQIVIEEKSDARSAHKNKAKAMERLFEALANYNAQNSLEQLAQEPVAWIKEVELGYIKSNIAIGKMDYRTNLGLKPEPDDVALYTHPAPSQWISVKDRLPDEDGEYLVYGNCTNEGYYGCDIAWFRQGLFRKVNQPNYWMPLPEAPKE